MTKHTATKISENGKTTGYEYRGIILFKDVAPWGSLSWAFVLENGWKGYAETLYDAKATIDGAFN